MCLEQDDRMLLNMSFGNVQHVVLNFHERKRVNFMRSMAVSHNPDTAFVFIVHKFVMHSDKLQLICKKRPNHVVVSYIFCIFAANYVQNSINCC